MARSINLKALDEKIGKAEQEVSKAKKNYDAATAELKRLLDKRDAFRSQELMRAVAESSLAFDEIILLIKSGGTSSKEE